MSIIVDVKPVLYKKSIRKMQSIVANIAQEVTKDTAWLLEHHHIYTSGYTTYSDWMNKYGRKINGIPLVETERGGQITYHGPGQRVCYVMIDLKKFYGVIDLSKFLFDIHQLIISVLGDFGIVGVKDPDYPGVWVKKEGRLNKIAAVGIKIRRGVSYHGIALNINTDLSYFDLIVPCGIYENNRGVTSIAETLGKEIKLKDIDISIMKYLKIIWGIDR
jgi:lipoyl(octanoyl) transferase